MSIRQRLAPTPQQAAGMLTHCAHARFVYNLGLEQRAMWTPAKRHFAQRINLATQMRDLTQARAQFDWLRAGSTVVQQGALRDLDRAFANFFAGRAAYPTWRKAGDRQGFVVRDLAVRRLSRRVAEVLVPKVGWVRFRLTRPWPQVQACTGARVTVDAAGTSPSPAPPPTFPGWRQDARSASTAAWPTPSPWTTEPCSRRRR